jgi:hypothetical protein
MGRPWGDRGATETGTLQEISGRMMPSHLASRRIKKHLYRRSVAMLLLRRLGKFAIMISLAVALVVPLACEAAKEGVPIKCSHRESRVGQGYVVQVHNQVDKTLSLWIESGGNKKSFTLEPYGSKEFGWLQGFSFGDNSSFSIGGEGYSTRTFSKSE